MAPTPAEKPKSRRRWCQFSLRTLLIVVTLAGVLSAVLCRLDFREPRQVVEAILAANMSPETRMKALEPYIDVGRSQVEIEKLMGRPGGWWVRGPGFVECFYHDGLIVEYYPDREACVISFRDKDGKGTILRSDDPITWPKTARGGNSSSRAGS